MYSDIVARTQSSLVSFRDGINPSARRDLDSLFQLVPLSKFVAKTIFALMRRKFSKHCHRSLFAIFYAFLRSDFLAMTYFHFYLYVFDDISNFIADAEDLPSSLCFEPTYCYSVVEHL